eukprot:TRINITY_DN85051_c0_g1_i1.p3 TRINITY_DN85051_c0_g1~~TRINITY_DN85051_c0_g1_i1.p3  ORF type:complete len:128 (-),score=61.63 TRINITY_DN85051_c0_g1_i1:196-579(-)
MQNLSAEDDIEVNKEDQENINKFSRMNLKYDDLDEEITKLKKQIQTYKDAVEEIETCMEDDGILLKVGEVFTPQEEDTVTEKLNKMIDDSEKRLTECTEQIEEVKNDMDGMKKVLYAKFGSNINLEK